MKPIHAKMLIVDTKKAKKSLPSHYFLLSFAIIAYCEYCMYYTIDGTSKSNNRKLREMRKPRGQVMGGDDGLPTANLLRLARERAKDPTRLVTSCHTSL
jgi:hypothetical protein